MKKLFWLAILVVAYLWTLTSGKDQFLLEKGKAIYRVIAEWIEDAEADFQLKEDKSKKRSRRWD